MTHIPKIILVYSIFSCIALYITENIYHPLYSIQMTQKIISFIIIPLVTGYIFSSQFGKFGTFKQNTFIYGLGFGIFGGIVIALSYFFLKDFIDWYAIRASMEIRGINETSFILIFLYIMFGNSLVEEFFFRGVVFHSLINFSQKGAYIISSLLFSLYHISIFGTWFSGLLLGLALFGLFMGGLFFAWLYEKTKGIWSAWIFHIIADAVILVIGYIQFFQ